MTEPSSLFCGECGAANMFHATLCFACHKPLISSAPAQSTQIHIATSATTSMSSSMIQLVQPTSGTLLHGRYKLVREIGQGGFGVVYLAEDCKQKQKQVAVKQINIGQLNVRDSIDATDSYNREVKLLSGLKHRRLPRIYDHFTDPEHWYLVMDYIEGQTLEAFLEATPDKTLPVKDAINIGIQICDVLHYLHAQDPPIIFRDVKPSNIMQTNKGQIYLIDFGIARHFVPGRARDTGPLGSPGYAAPEQYGTSQTNMHTDIYGLGATLQTLVTGKEPLDIQAEDLYSLSQKRHKKFQLLLNQMLEQERRKRPKNIREVRAILKGLRLGRKRFVYAYLSGILFGIAPYLLFAAGLALSNFASIFMILLYPLYCLWPFLLGGQVITAIVMFFKPRKRLVGLGILTGLALFILVLLLLQGSLSFLSPYGLFLFDG